MIKAITILTTIFLTFTVFSQNITNTLGTNGLFYIKDASNTFFSLKQSNGFLGLGTTSPNDQLEITKNFRMPYTTGSSVGVISKGSGDIFIHNFAPAGAYGGNIFLGIASGNFTMTAPSNYNSSYNIAAGYLSLYNNSTGYNNVAVGSYSMQSNTTGLENTAVGSFSLIGNFTGFYNTAVGYSSLYANTNNNNTAVGYYSLYSNTSGNENTAMGNSSLQNNTTGIANTAYGDSSMYQNTTGNYNTALGFESLYSTTKSGNVAIGYQSLFQSTNAGNSTGIGTFADYNQTSGTDVTCVGYNSQPSSGSVSNEITLGDNVIGTLRCNVQSITGLSDMRDKKNITDLSLGLDFLCKLKPRQFNWDKREWYDKNVSDGSKIEKKLSAGFIAQELDSVQVQNNAEWLNLVYKSNPDKLEAAYGKLLPVIVKSVQELKQKHDELKRENDELKQQVESMNALKERLSKMSELIEEVDSMKKDNTEDNIKTQNNK